MKTHTNNKTTQIPNATLFLSFLLEATTVTLTFRICILGSLLVTFVCLILHTCLLSSPAVVQRQHFSSFPAEDNEGEQLCNVNCRSMLYNGSDVIRDLEWVIFDEVHYINDAEVRCTQHLQ